MFKKLLPLLFLFAGFQANATIIEQTDGTLDWQYDDQSGLQWLDLTFTDNYSIQSALNLYTGWRLANKSEFQSMFVQYDVAGDSLVVGESCAAVVGTGEYSQCVQAGGNNFTHNEFALDFGLTYAFSAPSQYQIESYGFYDDEGTARIGGVYAIDRVDPQDADVISAWNNYGADYSVIASTGHHQVGQFLVRAVGVPEPSIIALFALGLVGIGIARRRQS